MTQPYQILGAGIPDLLGRSSQIQEIVGRIKANHIQVVAPKYFGKSVLLHGLLGLPPIRQTFTEVIYWDLAVHTPKTDAEFWTTFSSLIQTSFTEARSPYLKCLREQAEPSYRVFESLFKALKQDKFTVLLLLDGMDAILVPGYVKRDLLDNLRDLGQIGSIQFVTSSRKTLREISPAEVKTSPFLNLLNYVVRLGSLSENDWPEILLPLKARGFVLDANAFNELKAASGGVPILVAAVCSELLTLPGASTSAPKQITPGEVRQAAQKCDAGHREILQELWQDCPAEMQATLADVANGRSLAPHDLPVPRLEELVRRGYCRQTEKAVMSDCRLMDNQAKRNKDVVPDIKRLFAAKPEYEKNIHSLLELRLAQLSAIDVELRDYIQLAIRELPRPHVCIAQFRSIADRAMDLIWGMESDGINIPATWARTWTGDYANNPLTGKIPGVRADQLFVLRCAIDERNAVPLKAFSRTLFILLSQIHYVGNLGQHKKAGTKGQIDLGFMAANCFTAIQLAEQLSLVLKPVAPAASTTTT